ncbi:unnamed protein product [Mytilus coruscus]|uniref:Uncharacterized protein n=1 Tax=Mytilus coruscus TaxID=42192 RepID=A0A6J8D9R4_MYTCO|nr:unnamed protein product [Mytilus coruscus]
MIPNTESQSESIEWKASRWFRITASTAKRANTLGNLLKSPLTDASLRKFQAYISSTVWNISSFMYTSPDMLYGIENEDKARDDYCKLMATKVPDFKVEKTGFWLAIMGLNWCDFVMWSPIGTPNVERIRRDEQLIRDMIGNVTSLWHQVIAPEIFEMRVPRKLKPIILDL